jgi:O-antigen ligase
LLPIIFYNSLIIIKKEINTRSFERKVLINKLIKKIPIPIYKGQVYSAIRKTDSTTFTSHRYSNWKKVILKSKKPIIGYGPLGDRYLIEENSHNTLVYSYVSGGIVSTILMLILIIRYTYLCLFLTFIKKIPLQKKNIVVLSSIFTISFLFFRGIAEVGIAVFSIDFLVFLSCITICEKFKIQK